MYEPKFEFISSDRKMKRNVISRRETSLVIPPDEKTK